jgi:hypothetical protein
MDVEKESVEKDKIECPKTYRTEPHKSDSVCGMENEERLPSADYVVMFGDDPMVSLF